MDENIKKQLDDVCNIIDEKLEKSSKAIKDNVNNEIDTVVKGEVKNLVEKHSEMVERLDKIEVKTKKIISIMFTKLNQKGLVMHLVKVNHTKL